VEVDKQAGKFVVRLWAHENGQMKEREKVSL
jgi:hypothetical protein